MMAFQAQTKYKASVFIFCNYVLFMYLCLDSLVRPYPPPPPIMESPFIQNSHEKSVWEHCRVHLFYCASTFQHKHQGIPMRFKLGSHKYTCRYGHNGHISITETASLHQTISVDHIKLYSYLHKLTYFSYNCRICLSHIYICGILAKEKLNQRVLPVLLSKHSCFVFQTWLTYKQHKASDDQMCLIGVVRLLGNVYKAADLELWILILFVTVFH